jgi:hypothetical protein
MILAVEDVVKWNAFSSRAVHVGFVVGKVAGGQVSVRVLQFPQSLSFHQCFV